MQEIDFSSTGIGKWKIEGVDVVRSMATGLRWIRAPYGMKWNGVVYDGSPLKLTWERASARFGCGVYLEEKGSTIAMSRAEIERSLPSYGYSPGNENPVIGGRQGWRLPTLAEWRTIQFFGSSSTCVGLAA